MRVLCYQTWADKSIQEQLYQVLQDKGWISSGPAPVAYFYIPETLVTWCMLIDPTLKHMPKNDWII